MSAGRRAPPERVIIGVPHAAQSTDPGTLHDPPVHAAHGRLVRAADDEGPDLANIKSQKKRILTNEKARQRNVAVKSELKTAIRAVEKAVAAGESEAAVAALRTASRKLDKAASKGVIHKNQAANRKAGLAAKVNSL